MDEPTIPQTATFQLKLPSFEGPLDLLLHLIKKHELNVLDLPIAFVTERYLEYLSLMEELDLDIASEYLLMAATLAHIKSKMLLPQTPASEAFEDQDEGYQEDPRAELIRRLLEYQKYKHAAENLGGRPMAGRDVFPRGMPAPAAQGPAELAPIDMYKLLDAFQAILKRVQGRAALEVTAERITIHERMTQLSDFLRARRTCTFDELFEGARTRYEVVVTFLALLEMTKLRMTRVYQADPHSALHVAYALLDENGELPEDLARAFEGVTADSAPPPMAAEEFAATAFDEPTAAADGGEDDEASHDAWAADEPLAAGDAEESAAADDAWVREESEAAGVAEESAAADDAWVREESEAAGVAEESAAADDAWLREESETAASAEAPHAGHDAWVREEALAADDASDAWMRAADVDGADSEAVADADAGAAGVDHTAGERAGDADESAEGLAADGGEEPAVSLSAEAVAVAETSADAAVVHDAWVRDEPFAADGSDEEAVEGEAADVCVPAEAHDAWVRDEPLAADGGDEVPAPEAVEGDAGDVSALTEVHDAWVRDELLAADGGEDASLSSDAQPATAPEAERDSADRTAADESEPVSPNTDEWKP